MLCPNCQKEAINVNGKFVCLDCGVEIAAEQPAASPEPTPLINHGPTEQPTDILNNNEEQTVAQPFDVPQNQVDFTSQAPVQESPADLNPIQQVAAAELEQASPPEKPVEDLYLKSLDEGNETIGAFDFGSNATTEEPKPEDSVSPLQINAEPAAPDFPKEAAQSFEEPTSIAAAPVAASVQDNQAASDNQTIQNDSAAVDANTSAPAASFSVDEPVQDSTAPLAGNDQNPISPTDTENQISPAGSQDSAPASAPQDFFQPTSFDITKPEPQTEAVFDAFSTQAPKPGEEPSLENLVTESQNNQPEVQEVAAPTSPAAQEKSLDELLDSYSDQATPPQVEAPTAAPAFQKASTFDTVISAAAPTIAAEKTPNPQAIPPVETVFGQQPEMAVKPKATKKIILIAAAVHVGLLLLGGIVFAIMSLGSKTTKGLTNEQLLKVSQSVSSAMDDTAEIGNTFEEKIDFSQVSVAEVEGQEKTLEALKKTFEKPIETKGAWESDGSGNINFDAVVGGVKTKKIFISSENTLYAFSNNAWAKDTGKMPDFPLFSSAAKGQLFYNSKIESLVYLGKESVEGEEFQKIKVIPKTAFLKDVLTSEVPALGKNNYSKFDTTNLNIIAVFDAANTIRTVTVSGSVDIQSDYFSGVVNMEASSAYKYEGVGVIEAPISQAEPASAPAALETEILPKKVVITEIRG